MKDITFVWSVEITVKGLTDTREHLEAARLRAASILHGEPCDPQHETWEEFPEGAFNETEGDLDVNH